MLLWLSQRFDVHLLAFVDAAEDWNHTAELARYCSSQKLIASPTGPRRALRMITALLSGEPLSVAHYNDKAAHTWVQDTIQDVKPAAILAFSSAMGLFALNLESDDAKLCVDFVDVDSDKWLQYSKTKGWPVRRLFAREATALLDFDSKLARKANSCFFVSDSEAQLFRTLCPDAANKTFGLPNGVDTEFFSPEQSLANPLKSNGLQLVFTGAMDYWPNVDAVAWFVEKIMPLLRQSGAQPHLTIVGSKPAARVRQLENSDVIVTGFVDDTRPYLAHCDVVIAPLRIARGIQNKVLEGMAMGKTVVTTSHGAEGLNTNNGEHLLICDSEDRFADTIAQSDPAALREIGQRAREYVLRHHGWDACLTELGEHLIAPGETQFERAQTR